MIQLGQSTARVSREPRVWLTFLWGPEPQSRSRAVEAGRRRGPQKRGGWEPRGSRPLETQPSPPPTPGGMCTGWGLLGWQPGRPLLAGAGSRWRCRAAVGPRGSGSARTVAAGPDPSPRPREMHAATPGLKGTLWGDARRPAQQVFGHPGPGLERGVGARGPRAPTPSRCSARPPCALSGADEGARRRGRGWGALGAPARRFEDEGRRGRPGGRASRSGRGPSRRELIAGGAAPPPGPTSRPSEPGAAGGSAGAGRGGWDRASREEDPGARVRWGRSLGSPGPEAGCSRASCQAPSGPSPGLTSPFILAAPPAPPGPLPSSPWRSGRPLLQLGPRLRGGWGSQPPAGRGEGRAPPPPPRPAPPAVSR